MGGGPGGLFFATLMKRMATKHEVVVFERNRAEDTFGFGVVFSDATLSNLGAADRVLRERLYQRGQMWEQIELRLKGTVLRCGGNGMAAIARKALLNLLYRRAEEMGVDLRFDTSIRDLSQLDDFDLVVGSDGANSLVRRTFADSFAPVIETATAKFIWFGTTYRFEGLTFLFQESPYGVFAVHGYPIDESTGTFIVETDEQTWLAAGMDRFDPSQPPGVSDMYSKEYLESIFSDQINCGKLLVNNSRWANFRTISNRSWHWGKYVLIGDSAHTAHFSVGSGTKMAMEDATVLAACLTRSSDSLEEALDRYENERRPSVEGIQRSAGPSLSWWENFGMYYAAMEPQQFAYHFLTRAISGKRVARRDPWFTDDVLSWWVNKFGAEPLDSPFELPGVTVSSRIIGIRESSFKSSEALFMTATGPSVLALHAGLSPTRSGPFAPLLDIPSSAGGFGSAKARLEELLPHKPLLVAIRGGTSLERTLLAEKCRLEASVPTMTVEERFEKDSALEAVLSGRTDFVGVPVTSGLEFELPSRARA